jgi:hypothetical protein
LSVHRTFVVQFRAEIEEAPGLFAGRVEHVVSGQAAQFRSLEEWLVFVRRVLREVQAKGGDR